METKRDIDRLAGLVIRLCALAAIALLCWYFRSVLVYVIVAFVVSLVGQPLMRLLRRIKIKGKSAPDGLLAIITILVILAGILLFVTRIIPVVSGIIRDASVMNASEMPYNSLIDRFNYWIVGVFPSLGRDFDIVSLLLDKLRELVTCTKVNVLVSVTPIEETEKVPYMPEEKAKDLMEKNPEVRAFVADLGLDTK